MGTRPLRKIFIVRLWADADGRWEWQGEVQLAETGELQRIHSAGELLDYLQQTMAPQPDKPPTAGLH